MEDRYQFTKVNKLMSFNTVAFFTELPKKSLNKVRRRLYDRKYMNESSFMYESMSLVTVYTLILSNKEKDLLEIKDGALCLPVTFTATVICVLLLCLLSEE